MAPRRTSTKRELAAESWRLMVQLMWRRVSRRFENLPDQGLTPGHMKALLAMQADEPRSMGSLAETLGCDASMATWLVDRLEERGMVERRAVATDRRVRAIVVTERGLAAREAFLNRLYEPPEELLAADVSTLEALRDALAELPLPETAAPGPRIPDGQGTRARPA
jgi:DNA-binding MarR family transcriptional regulator